MTSNDDLIQVIKTLTEAVRELTEELRSEREQQEEVPGYQIRGISPEEFIYSVATGRIR